MKFVKLKAVERVMPEDEGEQAAYGSLESDKKTDRPTATLLHARKSNDNWEKFPNLPM